MSDAPRILITGGAGFIGSALARRLARFQANRMPDDPDSSAAKHAGPALCVYDALTYAGDRRNLDGLDRSGRVQFIEGDVCDADRLTAAIAEFQPTAIAHLAAETHVDRSIAGPAAFVRTNVLGAQMMLDAALAYWRALPPEQAARFRVLHASTDEVFGEAPSGARFSMDSPYRPSSPYSASKAAADHLMGAYARTYGLPTLIAYGSNTYGPRQYPEKLIPRAIHDALAGRRIHLYGDGLQVRRWLHVEDHAAGLEAILRAGAPGGRYVLGGDAERTNRAVAEAICDGLDAIAGLLPEGPRRALIGAAPDRPGHDRRYALDGDGQAEALGWSPTIPFEAGLLETIAVTAAALTPAIRRQDAREPG